MTMLLPWRLPSVCVRDGATLIRIGTDECRPPAGIFLCLGPWGDDLL